MGECVDFFILPDTLATAPENMAADTALLEAFPRPQSPRFRHYGWRGDCWTFGYAQKRADILKGLPTGAKPVRRPTGGGMVDHRDDWTYALAIPFAHPVCRLPAGLSYVVVHKALAQALSESGCPARLALCNESAKGALSACFLAPSPGDVVSPGGQKLAGAAQKRNRHGLLFQGSLAKGPVRVDWTGFYARFVEKLGAALDARVRAWDEPFETPPSLRQRYQSEAWNALR